MEFATRWYLVTAALLAGGLGGPDPADAQSAADSAAIRATALDYIDGWFDGDPERVRRAVHPDLAKRMVWTDAEGRSRLDHMSAMSLVDAAGADRDPVPADQRGDGVRIFEIFGDAAIVRVDTPQWVDYLSMIRWNSDWKIINVLWELKPLAKSRFTGR